MTLQNEITTFFSGYVDAFARNDADALSQLWDPVGLFPSPTGNFALERQSFRDRCVTLLEFYRKQGVLQPVGSLLSAIELFPNVVEARVDYRMVGRGAELIAAWEHIYVLRHTDCWRISLSIADGEIAAWAARGAQL